jgi:succinoglycan biosynthesis transport protein ExoP
MNSRNDDQDPVASRLMGGARGEDAMAFSLDEVQRVLRRQKLVVFVIVTITVLVVALISMSLPKRYEAVARIMLDFDKANSLNLDQLGLPTGSDAITKMETQIRIIRSETIGWEVVKDLRLYENPVFMAPGLPVKKGTNPEDFTPQQRTRLTKRLIGMLTVQLVPKTQIVEIRCESQDPKLAADIANSAVDSYIERNFRTKFEQTMKASNWLAKQLDDLKKTVRESEQKFTDYQKQTGMVGTDETHNIVTERLTELNLALSHAESDRITKEAVYRVLESGDPELVGALTANTTLQAMRTREAELQSQFALLTSKFGPNYPKVHQTKLELDEVHVAVQKELANTLARIKKEYESSARSETMLRTELERQKQDALRMNSDAIQFAIMKREVESNRDLYEGLLKKLKEAGVLAGLNSSFASIVDPASIPLAPSAPRVTFNLMMAVMGGLLAGIVVAIARENLNTSIRTPEEVELYCGIPTLGIIPRAELRDIETEPELAGRAELHPMMNLLPKTQFAESFRALRSSLLLASAGAPPKVIAVTSSLPSEGKTTVAVNISIALAQAGKRVLLVDSDLRRPCVHKCFGFPNSEGFSALLAGSQDESVIINAASVTPTLYVLPGGRMPPSPSELLLSKRFEELLRKWSEEYDHIVLDTPPVLAVNDSVIVGASSNAVLVIARAGKTGRQSLRRVRDTLRSVGITITGVLVNDVALNSAEYQEYYGHYGSYYSYYYGHEGQDPQEKDKN